MTRFILHIGPGKCGSTTIQNAFMAAQSPCLEAVRLRLFAPTEFVDLDYGQITAARLAQLDRLIVKTGEGVDVAILSHEFLFQTPQAAGVIAERLRELGGDVRVIGYVRPQSDLLRSTFSQWLFRASDRVEAVQEILRGERLEPSLLTGLEQQFIAAIVDDFQSARQLSGYSLLDLWAGYRSLEAAVAPSVLSVGVLPKTENDPPLLADFCARAGLTLASNTDEPQRANPKFHSGLVDALHAATVQGIARFDPHGGNEGIQRISNILSPIEAPGASFRAALFDYVNHYHAADNSALAARYHLPEDYFPKPNARTKDEILYYIHMVHGRRAKEPDALIQYYGAVESAVVAASGKASAFQR